MSVLTRSPFTRLQARKGRVILAAGLFAYAATVGIGLARCFTAAPGDELWIPLSAGGHAALRDERRFSAGGGVLSGSYWRSTCAFFIQSRTSPTLIGPGPSNPTGRGLPLDIAVWSAAAPFRAEGTVGFVADALDKRLTGIDAVNNPIGFVIQEHGAGWPVAAVSRRRTIVYVIGAGGGSPPHGSLSSSGETASWRANWLGIAIGFTMWAGVIGCAGAAYSFAARWLQGRKAVVPCTDCGYERAGIPKDAVCPECGKRP